MGLRHFCLPVPENGRPKQGFVAILALYETAEPSANEPRSVALWEISAVVGLG
jgi:hypothetical protein